VPASIWHRFAGMRGPANTASHHTTPLTQSHPAMPCARAQPPSHSSAAPTDQRARSSVVAQKQPASSCANPSAKYRCRWAPAFFAEYPIDLGFYPKGHKSRQGDSRTPEGQYWIDRHNYISLYFLRLGISNTNVRDFACPCRRDCQRHTSRNGDCLSYCAQRHPNLGYSLT